MKNYTKKLFKNNHAKEILNIYNTSLNRKLRNKILFYESSPGFGGSANALSLLVNNLDRKIFHPVVVIKNYGPKIERIKDAEIIKLKDYSEPKELSAMRFMKFFIKHVIPETLKLYFIIRSKKIFLTHNNTNINLGTPAILASKLAGVPCICHIRETRKLIKREKILAKLVSKFIVLNKNAYELYRQDIKEDKLSIIYDGIDLEEFNNLSSDNFRNEFSLNNNPVVGTVGRIVEGKGQKEFIVSAREVLKIHPEAKFVIVGEAKGGEDGYCKEIKDFVNKENLKEHIIFTGWRNDIKNVISNLDIFVFTSTTYPEGLPNSIIEAMALRKPVVSTDIPGPRDIVIDKETGFLVPPGDTKAMSEKINYLLANKEAYRKMGEAGRIRAEELFNIKLCAKRLEELYESLLQR